MLRQQSRVRDNRRLSGVVGIKGEAVDESVSVPRVNLEGDNTSI